MQSFSLTEYTGEAFVSLSPNACEKIDLLGVASGVAQFLKGPITSVSKLVEAPDQVLITVSSSSSSSANR